MAGEVLWVQANTGDEALVAGSSARQDRQLIDIVLAEGVIDGLSATEHADEWKVTIAAGRCVITGDDQADQGKYVVTFPVDEDVALNPPPGADKRIDVIYAQVRDPNAGGAAGYDAHLSFVEGATHATAPVTPSVPASAIPLCSVLRESTDLTWADASITDLRTLTAVAQLDVSTAPANGDSMVYNATTGLWEPGSSGTSSFGDLLDAAAVVKPVNESVTSSTTLQDDNDLSFAVGASEIWIWEAVLIVQGNATGDIKVGFTWPAAPTYAKWFTASGVAAASDPTDGTADVLDSSVISTSGGNRSLGNSTSENGIVLRGVISNGANAGTVALQWAQATSDGTNATVVRAGSHLIARRIA